MRGLTVLAAVTPDNTPHGYDLTFAVPIALFAVVAIALYLMFGRPHRRVPARRGELPARQLAPPEPDAARAAAVAGGLSVAAGGGSAESHLEPAGHVYGAGEPADDPVADPAGAGEGADAGDGPREDDGPAGDDRAEDGQ